MDNKPDKRLGISNNTAEPRNFKRHIPAED
jgi:hypothetical protein